jgi:5-methylcytosine-specific restriction endonuclease McrA
MNKKNRRLVTRLRFKSMVKTWAIKASQLSPEQTVENVFVVSKDFLYSPEWKALRLEAIKKYGSTCCKCGRKPSRRYPVNIDHIKPRRYYPELALDIDNLQPLCPPCNKKKGNKAPIDYRSPCIV